jgi:hypothetical protein
MKVYVALEDDRGCGPSVVGVYENFDQACAEAESSRYAFVVESEVVLDKDCTRKAEA